MQARGDQLLKLQTSIKGKKRTGVCRTKSGQLGRLCKWVTCVAHACYRPLAIDLRLAVILSPHVTTSHLKDTSSQLISRTNFTILKHL
jgi:hypothetical protein